MSQKHPNDGQSAPDVCYLCRALRRRVDSMVSVQTMMDGLQTVTGLPSQNHRRKGRSHGSLRTGIVVRIHGGGRRSHGNALLGTADQARLRGPTHADRSTNNPGTRTDVAGAGSSRRFYEIPDLALDPGEADGSCAPAHPPARTATAPLLAAARSCSAICSRRVPAAGGIWPARCPMPRGPQSPPGGSHPPGGPSAARSRMT